MDHFSSGQPGRLFQTRGSTSLDKQYKGGCMFIDHATKYIFADLHIHQNSAETILAKLQFEKHLFEYGVVALNYHADNGIFSSRDFTKHIDDSHQQIRFSGVGGHHQNGVAERGIGTILSLTRTMLVHANIRWPEVIKVDVWPMALKYAIWIYNHMPKNQNGISPIELLTYSKHQRRELLNAHVFGSPVYVLDPKLHSAGGFIPKFSPRSRRGVFVGMSTRHSSTIPLVLNLTTLTITPQYHVVFDDLFTTVNSNNDTITTDPGWLQLFNENRYQYTFDDEDDVILDEDWSNSVPVLHNTHQRMLQQRLPGLEEQLGTDDTKPDADSPPVTLSDELSPAGPVNTEKPEIVPETPVATDFPASQPQQPQDFDDNNNILPTVDPLPTISGSTPTQSTDSLRRSDRVRTVPVR